MSARMQLHQASSQLPTDASAVVMIEVKPTHVPTLKELLSLRRPPYRTIEEIVEQTRRDRDEWDD